LALADRARECHHVIVRIAVAKGVAGCEVEILPVDEGDRPFQDGFRRQLAS